MFFKFLNFRFQVWFNSFLKFSFGFSLEFVLGPNNGKDSCKPILIENASIKSIKIFLCRANKSDPLHE